MKRRVLVLDAFTNGHEAALAFIAKRGWTEAECEIVFCGTHANVFRRLTEGPAFAVVPVHNSIAGEVTEVTEALVRFRGMGYDLRERDMLDLQINHCLLAPQHVPCLTELEGVMSHEKAIQQCGRFLDAIGVTPEQRNKRDSTGNAAKAVANLGAEAKIGAIAPRAAAEEYGLQILAEGIQDVQDNKTRFILLENEANVRPLTVGIIGINGRFGQMFRGFFEHLGCTVIGSDKESPTGWTNAAVADSSDVVVFSVPIKDTPSAIRSLLPHVRPDQLLMDVTSIKQPAVEAMLESPAQVVGLHPMFRPGVPFDGQTVVACPARLTSSDWKTWVVNMLSATGARIKWSTAAEHDAYMIIVQALPHLANLASALVITESDVSVADSLTFTSPFYRMMFSLMGRLLSQDPGLYSSIVMDNPGTAAMLRQRIGIEQELLAMIEAGDRASFEGLFARASQHFGLETTQQANELFMRMFAVLNTLYGKNSVILEFTQAHSRPGLLMRVSEVFSRRGVNLTGINSAILDGRVQFAISFEQSRCSDGVRRALEEIERWPEPRVKVLD